jgi:hypothetical protein
MSINITTRVHFFLLAVLSINLGVNLLFGFALNNMLTVVLKASLYVSGMFLFFVSLKPFKKIAIYYSVYAVTPAVLVAFYLMHGIFLGLMSSLLVAPIMPLQAEYSKDDIKIYSKFGGFLGRCCEYYATEERFYIMEQFKGTIYTEEGIDFRNAKVVVKNDSLVINSEKVYKIKTHAAY